MLAAKGKNGPAGLPVCKTFQHLPRHSISDLIIFTGRCEPLLYPDSLSAGMVCNKRHLTI
jgi:hypothetical protein